MPPPRRQRLQKPPLTHFLCLPLLTPTSTPQLRASIAHLRSVIDTLDPAPGEANASPEGRARQRPTPPLVPAAAFRPLGTLHLTLGVMSLKGPEKLQRALKLLEELDLEGMLREVSEAKSDPEVISAEESAAKESSNRPSTTKADEESTVSPDVESRAEQALPSVPSLRPPNPKPPLPPPLLISLHPLRPFPPSSTPTNVTILHTPPNDPTSRLKPFCLSLLAAFKRAGYIDPEPEPGTNRERELTLHATLVNTVYAKKSSAGRASRAGGGGGGGGDNRRERGKVTFDATEILRVFNEEGGGGEQEEEEKEEEEDEEEISGGPTASSSTTTTTTTTPPPPPPTTGVIDGGVGKGKGKGKRTFLFASEIQIDRVQICEMGAKNLDPLEEDADMLGEAYVVVGEKRILPAQVNVGGIGGMEG